MCSSECESGAQPSFPSRETEVRRDVSAYKWRESCRDNQKARRGMNGPGTKIACSDTHNVFALCLATLASLTRVSGPCRYFATLPLRGGSQSKGKGKMDELNRLRKLRGDTS